MNLKFTVVTVVFNGEAVIQKTIESVLNQEYAPYEYLIFDGQSKDNTLKIIDSYKEQFEKRGISFVVTSGKDTGIYNAMNKGVKAAKGDFISFLNAGDWYELDALKNINAFYQEEPFELTYGGLHYINPNGTVTNKMSKNDEHGIVTSRHWNHPSMFLTAELYKQNGFEETFPAYADFNLYLKMRKQGVKIRVINKVITNFVADGVSTNTNMKKCSVVQKKNIRPIVEMDILHFTGSSPMDGKCSRLSISLSEANRERYYEQQLVQGADENDQGTVWG